ncbi:winged helix-turn-helix transcriptional regulator [Saccharothrix sp.]|uniref:winged helix-turn-helix transcriptional regulator n=1 Tax=Saccharothrix sp. TaxID=1873460 RepID=UPI002811AC11|nr:winged helix-turn-helix transcriptional regulator [Saccharothrix sp.]
MSTKRKYDDGCAAAHALDLVGERWALLIIRELLLGPKRFTDLRAGMPGASPNVLSQRLRELDGAGVVRRRKLPPPAAAWVYELTEWGQELEPVVVALGRWGCQSPTLRDDAPINPDALALSLKARFDPARTEGFTGRVVLRMGEYSFTVALTPDAIDVTRGEPEGPDAVVTAAPETLNAVMRGKVSPAEAVAAGELSVAGDRERAERFLGLFPIHRLAAAG